MTCVRPSLPRAPGQRADTGPRAALETANRTVDAPYFGRWTEGDDRRGAGAGRAPRGPRTRTIGGPPLPPVRRSYLTLSCTTHWVDFGLSMWVPLHQRHIPTVPPPPLCISHGPVQAAVGVGTVMIWDFCAAITRGGGGEHIWWTARTARGGTGHLGLTETQRGRLWMACGQRCVGSKHSQTTPATTSTTPNTPTIGRR